MVAIDGPRERREPRAICRLILGSSEGAATLAADLVGSVSLVVTSPPYHNAIDYESHVRDPSQNYRTRGAVDYAGEYLDLLNSVWRASWTMLHPGGYLVVNAGTVLHGGAHYPLPQDIVGSAIEDPQTDWQFIRTITWHKVTAGVKRAGTVIQHPYPGYWHCNIMTEHIQVLWKPGAQRVANTDVPEEWWEPVWDLAPVPPRTVDHPAPFPEDLPHRLIRMLTLPGDWVMDPFNGAGATTKAAVDLGRNALGFDLSPTYVETARARLRSPSAVRQSQLRVAPVPSADFTPGRSRGRTRHGAGLQARRRRATR